MGLHAKEYVVAVAVKAGRRLMAAATATWGDMSRA